MQILSLHIHGFKSYKDPITYEFIEGRNTIEGMNGQGKSSIMDAIAICVLNKTANGESKIEDTINLESKKYLIRIVFQSTEGNVHTIERTRDAKNMGLLLDGRESSQGDIDKIIGNPNIFLSVFNPHYFHNELTDTERKDIVLANMPPVDYHALWLEHVGDIELIEKYQVNFAKSDESSKFSKMIKNKEAERIAKAGEVGAITSELSISRQAAGKSQENHIFDEAAYNKDLAEFDELKSRLNNYSSKITELRLAENNLAHLNNSMAEIDLTLEQATEFSLMDLESIKAKRHGQNYKQVIPVTDKCYTCGAGLSPEQIEKITQDNQAIEQENLKTTQTIVNIDKAIKKIENAREYVALNEKLDAQNATCASLNDEAMNCLVGLTQETAEARIAELNKNIQGSRDIMAQQESVQASLEQENLRLNRMRSRIESLNAEVLEIDEELEVLRKIYESIKGSGTIRTAIKRMQTGAFEASLENCTVILEKELKNGNMTECFEIAYHGKPFRRISTAEKIRCSLEIGRYLCDQTGIRIPVFVDNAESIINVQEEDFSNCPQWFESYVRDGLEQVVVNGS